MWLISLRDLEWRRRRFAIAVVATGLVFGITLLLAGINAGFGNEVDRTVEAFPADAWVVAATAQGPFTTADAFPDSVTGDVAGLAGVRDADPMVVARVTVGNPEPKDVYVFGTVPGGIGPHATEGRDPRRSGEIVVATELGQDIGQALVFGGRRFVIVGTYEGRTIFAGQPTAVVPIEDARELAFDGLPLATSVMTRGVPRDAPPGFRVVTPDGAADDLSRPVENSTGTIGFLNILLWVIAAGIIGSVVYLTVIERTRDFAVLKATGISSRALFTSLALEAVVIALASAVVAVVMALVLSSLPAQRVEISTMSYLVLAGVAVVVGVLASLVGLRRAVGVDPALAFG